MSKNQENQEIRENGKKKVTPFWTDLRYRYTAYLLLGVVGGVLMTSLWHGIVIMPNINNINVNVSNNSIIVNFADNGTDSINTTIPTTTTLPNGNTTTTTTTPTTTTEPITTTIPTTTEPPLTPHFELVLFIDPPHTGKYLIAGNIDLLTIYFNVTVRETEGVNGTCYLKCYVETTSAALHWDVLAYFVAYEERVLEFRFTVTEEVSDAIKWGTAEVTILGSD